MKIRIIGVPAEYEDAVVIDCDPKIFTITQMDAPYPNLGGSRLVRFYVEVQLPPDSGTDP
jgi:hypothetical protein